LLPSDLRILDIKHFEREFSVLNGRRRLY